MKRIAHFDRAHPRTTRLASAIAGVLILASTYPAFATPDPVTLGTTTLTMAGPAGTTGSGEWSQTGGAFNYLHAVVGWQSLVQPVTSTLSGSGVLVNGFASGEPIANADQTVQSRTFDASTGLVGANAAANSVDLGLLGRDEVNEGLGILSGQLANGGSARADVSGGYVTTSLSDYTQGSIAQTGNAIEGSAVINNVDNRVVGTAPQGFVGSNSATIDSVTNSVAGDAADVTQGGTVTIANVQSAVDANANGTLPTVPSGDPIDTMSYAHVKDSGITVVDIAIDQGVAASVSLDRNHIAASYGSNQANNGFSATSGSYAGSVAISNTQQNIDHLTVPGQDMALVQNGHISSDVVGSLEGAVSLANDAIAATALGNAATNQVAFAQGVDVIGSAVNGKLSANSSTSGTQTVSETGDVLVSSMQSNVGTRFDSHVMDSGIQATTWGLDAGSAMSLDGDAITSVATGNMVSNGVVADGTSYTANTLIASQQTSTATMVAAQVEGSGIGLDINNGGLDDLGTATLANSSISGSATANDAVTRINVQATNVAVYNNTDQTYARPTNAWTDKAGFGASNFQSNDGAALTGVVSDSDVSIDEQGNAIGAVTLRDNAIGAGATGNKSQTSIGSSGTNGAVGGQLANSQSNSSSANAMAYDSGVMSYVGGTASGAVVTDGNMVSSVASGNRASNIVSASFDHLSSGEYVDPWTVESSVIDPVSQYNTSEAPFAIASNQYNSGFVAATTENGTVGSHVGELAGSALSVGANGVGATAIGNTVSNGLAITAGDLQTDSGTQDQVASLGNLQKSLVGGTTATVAVDGTDPRKVGAIGAFVDGSIDASTVAVSGNSVHAAAYGNEADNTLAFAGGSFAPDASQTASGKIGYIGTDSHTVSASFALQNVQTSEGFAWREASVTNGNVGINLTQGAPDDRHVVTESTLSVDNNAVTADVRDNYAANRLGLGVSYASDGTASADPMSLLATTAGLQNAQTSNSYLSSTVGGLVGVIAGHYDVTDSALTFSGNSLKSTAIANTGFNRLDVAATELAGDSSGVALPGPGVADYSAYPDLGLGIGIGADYGLSNVQSSTSLVISTLSGTGVGMGVGEGSVNGGSVAITGNMQAALALQNSASNTVNLLGTQVAASAGMSNKQSALGTSTQATASTDIDSGLASAVQVQGALGASSVTPVTIDGNTVVAQAGGNDASNTLYAKADGSLFGQMFAMASTGNALGLSPQAYGDLALYNDQSISGSVIATAQPGLLGVEVVGMNANGVSSTIGNADGNSALTVSGNQVSALATSNNAVNVLSVDGTGTVTASAAVTSMQNASGLASASVGASTIGVYNRDVGQPQGGVITNAALAITGNQVAASASGNTATNQMVVKPAALNATVDVTDQVGNGDGTLLAVGAYAVLNAQANTATTVASVTGVTIGVNADVGNANARGSLAQLTGGSLTISGNSALASAAGNTASSSIAMSAMPGSTPSTSLVSSQVNSASINASVASVQIGAEAGMGTALSRSPITVSGNTISASAVGNSATNVIGIAR